MLKIEVFSPPDFLEIRTGANGPAYRAARAFKPLLFSPLEDRRVRIDFTDLSSLRLVSHSFSPVGDHYDVLPVGALVQHVEASMVGGFYAPQVAGLDFKVLEGGVD